MARRCSICEDQRLSDIEKALSGPRSRRLISEEFGIPKHRLDNHAQHSTAITEEYSPSDAELAELYREARWALAEAKKNKSPRDVTNAVRELRGIKELDIRVHSGQSQAVALLTSHPSFQAFIAELLPILGTCKACRPALDAAVGGLATPGGTRGDP